MFFDRMTTSTAHKVYNMVIMPLWNILNPFLTILKFLKFRGGAGGRNKISNFEIGFWGILTKMVFGSGRRGQGSKNDKLYVLVSLTTRSPRETFRVVIVTI